MKKTISFLVKLLVGFAFLWVMLTLFVQMKGVENVQVIGASVNGPKALVIYDPDPFYDLDQQVCIGFAEGLAEQNWLVVVATVAAAENLRDTAYALHAFCANTYNWAPDRAVRKFIRKSDALKGQSVVAFTVGSGSTQRAQRLLEEELKGKNANLLNSISLWLMRPNDESRIEESNVAVAVDMARTIGKEVGREGRVTGGD